MNAQTQTGIPGIGALPWGSHFCNFYESGPDLADTLVPFFKAGLENEEACIWVTSAPLHAADARACLSAAVPDLAAREARGQIEIIDHTDWYLRTGAADAEATLRGWVEREQGALAAGFAGLRLTGNTYWLERADWLSFMEYERLVTSTFAERRIVGLCSYCAARCNASDVLDVIGAHQFSLSRRNGSFEVVEGAQLRVARDDLLRLRHAWEELQELDRRKDELFAIVGHELRNPLAPMRSAVQLMKLRGGHGWDRQLAVFQRQLDHMTKLVDDLLDVARLDRGVELSRTRVDVSDLVADASELVADLLTSKAQTLSVRIDGALAVEGDFRRLKQVLGNLLVNASKHTQRGGAIHVEAERRANDVEIHVRDEGPGIAPELLARIFEPFVQGKQGPDRSDGGLGLGLTIVKRIVELHGGTVRAMSTLQVGSTFTVRLASATAPGATSSSTRSAPFATEARRVLLVDDNLDAAEMLAELIGLLGHEVDVAHDGKTALRLVERSSYDLALLDLGLPDSTGHELGERIRERSPTTQLAIVSGYAQDEERAKSARLGFIAHLAKPVDIEEIGALLSVSRGGDPETK